MTKWTESEAFKWYKDQDWIVGCNYIPSNAINQLEMFQPETFDIEINERELSWANNLGFNSVRVYLHELLWNDQETFKNILREKQYGLLLRFIFNVLKRYKMFYIK